MNFTIEEINKIIERCRADEYTCFISFYGESARVTLEKGSAYGKMHMKFEAEAPTASEAFEKCVLNFPRNPVGAVWDTKWLNGPAEDGVFTEVAKSDDIPF